VESNAVFGLLYLHNNLHVAHHLKPAMPWYDIPRFYRENRSALLESNGNFVYKGYGVLAKRYFFARYSVRASVSLIGARKPVPTGNSRAIVATSIGNMLEWYDFTCTRCSPVISPEISFPAAIEAPIC